MSVVKREFDTNVLLQLNEVKLVVTPLVLHEFVHIVPYWNR